MSSQASHSGRLHKLNGRIFYCPNSTRDVLLPRIDEYDQVHSNPFTLPDPSVIFFREPHWWTVAFGWLAFVPRFSKFLTYPMNSVLYVPPLVQDSEAKFSLPDCTIHMWKSLEHFLYFSCVALKSGVDGEHAGAIPPFLPIAFGYERKYRTHRQARRQVMHAREWFAVWEGLLSSWIALYHQIGQNTPLLSWHEIVLKSELVTDVQISSCLEATFCLFDGSVERAGLFIRILTDSPQPSPLFYHRYNIPIWYEFGNQEMEFLRNREWLDLCPPVEMWQDFVAGILPELNPTGPDDTDVTDRAVTPFYPTSPSPAHISDVTIKPVDIQPYLAFVNERKVRIATAFATGTPKQIEYWTYKQANPPTTHTIVYVWDVEGLGGPVSPALARKSENSDILDSLAPDQKFYDPIFNDWQCCDHKLDPSNTDPYFIKPQEDDEDYEDARVITHDLRGYKPPHCPLYYNEAVDVGSIDTTLTDHLPFEHDSDFLHLFYGFNRFASITPLSPEKRKSAKDLLWCLGGVPNHENAAQLENQTEYEAIQVFLHRLTTLCIHPGQLSDLNPPSPLKQSVFWYKIRQLGDLYVLDFVSASTVPWKVAIKCAADVLMVLRMDPCMTDYDIARFLLENGIPFHTLRRTRELVWDIDRRCAIPTRPGDHTFTLEEFNAYYSRLEIFLRTDRGRAALMEGGIVWRIAKDGASFADVLSKQLKRRPDSDSILYDHPSSRDQKLFDDKLTQSEIYLICGAYECQPTIRHKAVMKSWWPLPEAVRLKGCGMSWGRWTPQNEEFYRNRFAKIKSGNQPLSGSGFRDLLRGRRGGRKLWQTNLDLACEFLKDLNFPTIS